MNVLMCICVVRFLIVGASCGPVERPPRPHVPGRTRSGCPVQDMGHCGVRCCQERVLVWRGFRGPGRWSQRRTRSTLLLQGPGGVATRLVQRIGGPAVHGDSEQHAGYGHHHLRWGKAQEGQGKRRDGSSGANGNGTIAIRAAKFGSSDSRGATGVQWFNRRFSAFKRAAEPPSPSSTVHS